MKTPEKKTKMQRIAALKADLARSFNYATEMKPDGA